MSLPLQCMCHHAWLSLCGSGGVESGLHACTASMLRNEPSCQLPIFPVVIFASLLQNDIEGRLQVPTVREQTKFILFSSSWFLRVAVSQSAHIVFSSLCKRSAPIHQLFPVRNELSAAEIICPPCAVYGKEGDVRGFMSVTHACVTGNLSPASFFVFSFVVVLHLCMCMLSG